jgi:ATP-dependent RNA helicase RhlB
MVKKFIKKLGQSVWGSRKKSPTPEASPTKPKTPRSKSRRPSEKREDSKKPDNWSIDDFKVEPHDEKLRFHDFELPDPIMHAIHDLGFEYCTPIQSKVLAHAREGLNIAGRAQTGTGKTAAFLTCMLAQFIAGPKFQGKRKAGAPRALILAPTRELVIQIIEDAQDLSKHTDFRCFAVFGGMDFEKQKNQLLQQPVDIIAATPGRLLDFKRRGVLDLKHVEVLVIDEADRMLDMGFIPDVSSIIRATPPKDKRQTMLYSATLTEDVLRLASQWMPDPVICEVEPDKVAVDTVEQIIYTVQARDKFKLLYNLLQKKEAKKVLVFGNRRDSTKRLADNLERHGIPCSHLSGAVRQEKRLKVLDEFKATDTGVVVATDVAGRGIHVDDITHVVNYEFPYEPEDYVHRIGRTGRAGREGTAISFACEEESFVIPEIEEYIGQPLKCTQPEEELLKKTPPPSRRAAPEREERRTYNRSGGRPSGGGRGRPGGNRSRR